MNILPKRLAPEPSESSSGEESVCSVPAGVPPEGATLRGNLNTKSPASVSRLPVCGRRIRHGVCLHCTNVATVYSTA